VFQALIDAAINGDLKMNFGVSMKRAASGFIFSLIIALPLGFLLGTFFSSFEKALLPFLKMLEKLNPFALFPIFMIFFGIGDSEKIAIIFWVAQFPLLFHTIAGAKGVDVYMLKSARSMGAPKRQLFLKVIFPSALPNIFTGIKIAAQVSFFMIIASEYAGSSEGLGYYYLSANQGYQIPLSYGIVIFITVLSIIVNVLFTRLEKHFLVWKETSF
jgi:NitT/TauT family transport system permease protein